MTGVIVGAFTRQVMLSSCEIGFPWKAISFK